MAHFLFKGDPGTYGLNHLEKDRTTVWDGVANPVACKNIRAVKAGDDVLVYHTEDEKAVVGLARATSDGRPDPRDPKLAVVELSFVARARAPLSLATIKADDAFADLPLVRAPRLSAMPIPEAAYRRLCKLAGLD